MLLMKFKYIAEVVEEVIKVKTNIDIVYKISKYA